jgi:mono/diheme cytochrome c family protein
MVDNDAERPAGSDGSYGSIVDGDPRIEPLVSAPCGSHFARFDQSNRELSGPVALAWDPAARRLWVVGRFTGTVAVLECGVEGDPGDDVDILASFRVGEGARGIALSSDGLTAYVDVGFDYSVAELHLDPVAPRRGDEPARVVRRETGALSLSADAQAGRRTFNDARDRHLTPSSVATCASCHLDGGDDGVTWRISTDDIPSKLRRTPPLWQLTEGSKPLHWDGAFDSSAALTSDTIRNLLGGDGLLIDTAKVSEYLASLDGPPPADVGDPAAVAEGAALFETACARCHVGESGSDGLTHDLGRTSTDRDGVLDQVVTPTLFGTRARAPYFHDGSADSLAAALTDGAHGSLPELDDRQRERIATYLLTR